MTNSEVPLHQKELDRIIREYRISAKNLAEASKVHPVQLSKFRNGKQDFTVGAFIRIIDNLPNKARTEYLQSVFGFTENISPGMIKQVLLALAEQIDDDNQFSEDTDSSNRCELKPASLPCI